jgi:hypothetical protein
VVRRAAMIAAFHPSATFSVRFVGVLVSPAGEKAHAAGEKRDPRGAWGHRDRTAAVRDWPGRRAGWRDLLEPQAAGTP